MIDNFVTFILIYFFTETYNVWRLPMVQKVEKIWWDGRMINWDDANLHLLTHTLHYGLGVFEGIRCYQCYDGRSAIFRLKDHVRRFFDSALISMMELPFTQDQIIKACKKAVSANGLKEAYIRPIAWIGEGSMGVYPGDNPVHVAIAVWSWGAYLGEEALNKGIRCKVSSFVRCHVNSMMSKAKICGNYVNSVLAKREAMTLGYDEAILLDTEGYVSEGSGENIFIVRGQKIKTAPPTSILGGITRDSVMTIASDLGYEVKEQRFTRDEMWCADEVFFTGTAAEITPIREIDDRKIGRGERGPVTKHLQDAFFEVVRGKNSKYEGWLDYL